MIQYLLLCNAIFMFYLFLATFDFILCMGPVSFILNFFVGIFLMSLIVFIAYVICFQKLFSEISKIYRYHHTRYCNVWYHDSCMLNNLSYSYFIGLTYECISFHEIKTEIKVRFHHLLIITLHTIYHIIHPFHHQPHHKPKINKETTLTLINSKDHYHIIKALRLKQHTKRRVHMWSPL